MTTPLFIEDIAVARRGKFETFLRQVSGTSNGSRHFNKTESLMGEIKSASPGLFNPEDESSVKELAKFHPLITWKKLKYAIIPGPGSFGRTVTIHFGWVPPGIAAPRTAGEFANLPGYTFQVFGGVADPHFAGEWMEAPFDEGRHAVVHSGLLSIAKPMRLAWFMDVAEIADKKGAGAQVFIRFEGELEVFGQFY